MNKTALRLGILGYAVVATAATVALYVQSYPSKFQAPPEEGRLICSEWNIIEAYQVPNGVLMGAIKQCKRYTREKEDERTETPGPSGTKA